MEEVQRFVKNGAVGVQAIRRGRFGVHRLTCRTRPMISASSLILGTASRGAKREEGQWVPHAEAWKTEGLIRKAQRDHHPLRRYHYRLRSPRVSEGNFRVLEHGAMKAMRFERRACTKVLTGAKELETMWTWAEAPVLEMAECRVHDRRVHRMSGSWKTGSRRGRGRRGGCPAVRDHWLVSWMPM